VDDGSLDGSVAAVESLRDNRIKLLRHSENRGQGAARNTGVHAASREWVISLDSDDELLPGALTLIASKIASAGDVDRLGFMFERDDGNVSPLPRLTRQMIDYRGYLEWFNECQFYDFLPCTRRNTFENVLWRERRWTDHCLYHLDFAQRYRTLFCPEFAGRVHTDAQSRVSYQRREPARALRVAAALGEEIDLIFFRHGQAMRRFAPAAYQKYQQLRTSQYFLAGARLQGLRHSLRCLRAAPLSWEAWAIMIAGAASPRMFAALRSAKPPST
jgi:glycosyltransferase involved in cell wall biosynthesis